MSTPALLLDPPPGAMIAEDTPLPEAVPDPLAPAEAHTMRLPSARVADLAWRCDATGATIRAAERGDVGEVRRLTAAMREGRRPRLPGDTLPRATGRA
jgi:hypothetical protein